ncbi:uncharacterized protein [Littorina saxatilis]|uniref:uncharacterized protein isoform X2 n=1 Tax=Littorina saxatilis TaxID=31220 RepID=UPI0038B452D5
MNTLGLRAVLCLSGLVAGVDMFGIHPSQRRSAEVDLCNTSMELWIQYVVCTGDHLGNFTSAKSFVYSRLRTKENFGDFLKELCGKILPAARICVADHVSGCDATTREEMEQAVQSSGFLCQAGGTTVNSAVLYVLSQLSEDDFIQADQTHCRITANSQMCFEQGLEAAGTPYSSLQPGEALSALSNNFSLDTSSSRYVPFVKAFTKCQVRSFRERSSDCPAWRAVALANIALDMNDGILGMQMPFTILEWKEMMDL